MSDKKKFGLVMPKKVDTLKTRINSIFNDESDNEETVKKRPKIPQKKMIQKSSIKTEFDLDPTIYEYDSIYDEMKTEQAESNGTKEIKKCRYIDTLLKAADKRKKEYERRIDRKIQIEREKEGDQFKDKEAFVTSSYKKKLQEKEEEEERERRENLLNDMMDVTKQKDLSGFYRHFLNQTIGEEKVPLFGERLVKKEVESDKDSDERLIKKEVDSDQDYSSNEIKENTNNAENIDQDSDGIEIDNEDDDDSEKEFSSNEESHDKKKEEKIYRKKTALYRNKGKSYKEQKSDSNMAENLEKSKYGKTDIKKCSISSSSDVSLSDFEDNEPSKKFKNSDKRSEKDKCNMNQLNSRHDSSSSDGEHNNKSDIVERKTDMSKEKKKRNIYAKRTVGDIFAEAQARYFQRMAIQNA